MLCEECEKNSASLHFTKIINGQKTELHLCEECARDKEEMFTGNQNFSFNSLLSGILNFDQAIQSSSTHSTFNTAKQLKCNKCGMPYHQFAKVGRFGCANCYETFKDKIDPILRRVHSGNTTHLGKIPKRIGGNIHIRKEMDQLKESLQKAIHNEEFEKAAELRDHIRSLEKSLLNDGEG